jgi:hypothetical protein
MQQQIAIPQQKNVAGKPQVPRGHPAELYWSQPDIVPFHSDYVPKTCM